MSADKSLLIRINGNAQGLRDEYRKIRSETEVLSDALSSAAKNSAIAFAGLTASAVGMVAAFREDEQAAIRTEATLKATGHAAGLTAQALFDLSTEMEKVTTFSDDAVLSAENLLLTFRNIGKDVFPQATEATLNIATAMGTDANSAAIQLGKALNDPIQGISALTRVGVSFTDAQKEQIKVLQESGDILGAQKIILRELEQEFGGVARAATQGTGVFIQLKNALDGIFENMGEAIFGTIQPFVKSLLDIVQKVRDANPELYKLASNVLLVGIAVTGFITVLATAGVALLAANAAVAALGITLAPVLLAVTAISAAVVYLGSNMEALRALVTAGQAAWEVYYTTVNRFVNDLIIGFNNLIIAGKELAVSTLEALPGAAFAEQAKVIQQNIEELRLANARLQEENAKTGQSFEDIYDRIDAEKAAEKVRAQEEAIAAERAAAKQKADDLKAEQEAADLAYEQQKRATEMETRAANFEADMQLQIVEQELIQAQKDKASEVEKLKLQQKIDALKKIRDKGASEEQKQDFENKDALRKAAEKDQENRAKFQEKAQTDTLNAYMNLNSRMLKEGTAAHKALFLIEKAAAFASAVINTAKGVAMALGSYPPPLSFALAAATAVAGAVQIATIVGSAFGAQDGALVGGTNNRQSGDRIPYMLEAGELVVPKRNFEEVITATAQSRGFDTGGGGGNGGQVFVHLDLSDNAAQFITARQYENGKLGTDRG